VRTEKEIKEHREVFNRRLLEDPELTRAAAAVLFIRMEELDWVLGKTPFMPEDEGDAD
jgi:hypothetical protein